MGTYCHLCHAANQVSFQYNMRKLLQTFVLITVFTISHFIQMYVQLTNTFSRQYMIDVFYYSVAFHVIVSSVACQTVIQTWTKSTLLENCE